MSLPNPPSASDPVTYEPAPEAAAPESPPTVTLVPSRPPSFWRHRRLRLPLILFALTCASAWFAGATGWLPPLYLARAMGVVDTGSGWPVVVPGQASLMPLRQAISTDWDVGLLYMACVIGILLTHELGHFITALIYRVRTSLPYFVPLPISPIGTLGAVIVMHSHTANRRQIFDIGLAGPIAGLVIAFPIFWIGILQLDLTPSEKGELAFPAPLAMRLAIDHLHPGKYDANVGVPVSQMNAWYMAGWVGLLVTGLNMLPVSQLDGGHVTYALFGRAAHWIARGFMLVAFGYMGVLVFYYGTSPSWILMAALVMALGTDHPPTSDDTVPLGWFRTLLGYASLAIPIFCFVPNLQL